MKYMRIGSICLALWLAAIFLSACGEEAKPTQTPSQTGAAGLSPATTIVPGSRTAVPFLTPVAAGTAAPTPGFKLAFDFKPGTPVLDVSVTTPLPEGRPDDWSVVVDGSGTAKYTKNPRNKTGAVTVEYHLNQDKLNNLLQELNKLGALEWPETTAPDKVAAGGTARSLHLYLQGRTKAITDLSGGKGDALTMMLDLIKKTVEEAPAKQSA
ncbi:MAG: hypothetical protein JWP00_2811 [Chloroflexi bacterium]|nr:hypothetical protein [Chloroflexota bacterium]